MTVIALLSELCHGFPAVKPAPSSPWKKGAFTFDMVWYSRGHLCQQSHYNYCHNSHKDKNLCPSQISAEGCSCDHWHQQSTVLVGFHVTWETTQRHLPKRHSSKNILRSWQQMQKYDHENFTEPEVSKSRFSLLHHISFLFYIGLCLWLLAWFAP